MKLVKISGQIKEWLIDWVWHNLCRNEDDLNCNIVQCNKELSGKHPGMWDAGYPASHIRAFSKSSLWAGYRSVCRDGTYSFLTRILLPSVSFSLPCIGILCRCGTRRLPADSGFFRLPSVTHFVLTVVFDLFRYSSLRSVWWPRLWCRIRTLLISDTLIQWYQNTKDNSASLSQTCSWSGFLPDTDLLSVSVFSCGPYARSLPQALLSWGSLRYGTRWRRFLDWKVLSESVSSRNCPCVAQNSESRHFQRFFLHSLIALVYGSIHFVPHPAACILRLLYILLIPISRILLVCRVFRKVCRCFF